MSLLRDLWIAEPVLTSIAGLMAILVLALVREAIVSHRTRQEPVPYNWD
jgi:hypothetical protein